MVADYAAAIVTSPVIVITPQIEELEPLLRRFGSLGHAVHERQVGRLSCSVVETLGMILAVGGHGKSQFALQAQHVIDSSSDPVALLCVGAAGHLRDGLTLGDVIVGTATVEHDYKERFSREPLPCHESDGELLEQFKTCQSLLPFAMHFDRLASGDEDIIDRSRAAEVYGETQAACVAWEGSGGARAARFSGLPFLEIRCITDGADDGAARSYRENLERVMPNVAELLVAWRAAQQPR